MAQKIRNMTDPSKIEKIQLEIFTDICIQSYSLVKGQLSQTFFMPLSITLMAVIARIKYLTERIIEDPTILVSPVASVSLDFFGQMAESANKKNNLMEEVNQSKENTIVDHDAELNDIFGSL